MAFESDASNFAWDNNDSRDVFVRDRQTKQTERVSISSDGTEANSHSHYTGMSATGRFIIFRSDAKNLVPGDTNGMTDLFIRDRELGTTECVSLTAVKNNGNSSWGLGTSAISMDGRFVAFAIATPDPIFARECRASQLLICDRKLGTTKVVSLNNMLKHYPMSPEGLAFSPDGSLVALVLFSTENISHDTVANIFICDTHTGALQQASVGNNGEPAHALFQHPKFSSDNRFLSFRANHADKLWGKAVDGEAMLVRDLLKKKTYIVECQPEMSFASWTSNWGPFMSADGHWLLYHKSGTTATSRGIGGGVYAVDWQKQVRVK